MHISETLIFAVLACLPSIARSQKPVTVTGLNTAIAADGERPVRFNIDYLQALGGPQW